MAAPKAVWAYDLGEEVHMPEPALFEPERTPINTGLLDAGGRALYRMPEEFRLGFDLRPRIRVKAKTRKL